MGTGGRRDWLGDRHLGRQIFGLLVCHYFVISPKNPIGESCNTQSICCRQWYGRSWIRDKAGGVRGRGK